MTAPDTNTSGGVREFFWRTNMPFYADQQACITWNTPTGANDIIQPGLALRIAPTGEHGEGVRGITVNENIWYSAVWIVWVNVWDSTDTDQPYYGVEMFDLSPIVGKFWWEGDILRSTLVPGPWHVCARTQGLELTFKVWTGTNPEPPWDDSEHVFKTTLPEGWDYPGYSGGYIGHMRAGETAVFSGQSSGPLCLASDMVDTDHCQAKFASAGISSPSTSLQEAGTTTIPVSTIP